MTLLALLGCMTMDGFFFANERVEAYGLQSDVIPADSLEEVAFDGEAGTLYGAWAHQDAADAPLFLYFHGNARHMDEYVDKVEVYWAMGFEVFFFDYRGFGKSEGDPSYDGVIADGASAVAYVEDVTGSPSEDVVFHGLSLGGAVAVHIADELPPRVLITEDMFASGQQIIDDASGLALPPGWMLADEWDNAAAAADVHVPFLVIHGAEDTYIQPGHAEAVYAMANDPKKLWLAPGAGHADSDLVDPEAYRENVACWIEQTCPEE